MIRFRNPGTQYSTQVQVIKQLYEALHTQTYFTLEDMAVVIAQGRLMTAYGYAGDDALRLSNTDQESMNSALMNAKMYAEVFRMLGWVTPYDERSSYPLVFTYIGIHVALSTGDCSKLYEQCVLGINNPTQLTDKMHYDEKVRFFKCALRSFIDLGGIIYKHELCLGPMSVNDEDEKAFNKMIQYIKSLRGNYGRLKRAFENLATNLGMKTTPSRAVSAACAAGAAARETTTSTRRSAKAIGWFANAFSSPDGAFCHTHAYAEIEAHEAFFTSCFA